MPAATMAIWSGGGSSAGGAQVSSASYHCSRSDEGHTTSSGQSSGKHAAMQMACGRENVPCFGTSRSGVPGEQMTSSGQFSGKHAAMQIICRQERAGLSNERSAEGQVGTELRKENHGSALRHW